MPSGTPSTFASVSPVNISAIAEARRSGATRPVATTDPERVEEPWYDARHEVRRVNRHGQIKWQGEETAIGEALVGEPVGLAELASGDWLVRFAGVELGVIERRGLRFWRYGPARPGRAVAPDTTENKTRNLSAMSPV